MCRMLPGGAIDFALRSADVRITHDLVRAQDDRRGVAAVFVADHRTAQGGPDGRRVENLK